MWLREEDIVKAHGLFTRHGSASVFFGRLLPVIRTFISLPAGFAYMPPLRFGLYTFAGCLPWTAAPALVGYAIGANWHTAADAFKGPTYIIAAIVVVACAAAVAVFIRDAEGPRRTRNRVTRAKLISIVRSLFWAT